MSVDRVDNKEELYRRIPQNLKDPLYEILNDGSIRFHSPAFADRQKWRPSVDRKLKCGTGATHAQEEASDGVISLLTEDVRKIQGVTQNSRKGAILLSCTVDVEPKPIPVGNPEGAKPNPAHAEIFTKPDPPDETVYRKLCKKLALLASNKSWEIPPLHLR